MYKSVSHLNPFPSLLCRHKSTRRNILSTESYKNVSIKIRLEFLTKKERNVSDLNYLKHIDQQNNERINKIRVYHLSDYT